MGINYRILVTENDIEGNFCKKKGEFYIWRNHGFLLKIPESFRKRSRVCRKREPGIFEQNKKDKAEIAPGISQTDAGAAGYFAASGAAWFSRSFFRESSRSTGRSRSFILPLLTK